jgi:C-terminal processing protease CtpA/Prc
MSIPDPPNFRTEVDRVLLKCDENKFAIDKVELWNSANELVRVQALDRALGVNFLEFKEFSPFASLHEIICGKGYAGLGLRLGLDNSLIKVAGVFDGSPAERAGVKVNDIISQIDNNPVSGLTLQQVIEKTRGPANTNVALTIVREGRDNPLELTITREIIKIQSTQEGPSK